ncbi:MAG: esterase, partial [Chitinophagaceae bacterium]|nr:esterase [Chitinophagaceae bacterium]
MNSRRVVFLCLVFASFIVQAQYRVTLRISKLPSYHLNSETLYLAGTFNNWNPAQREYAFENNNGAYSLTLAVPSEKYEYKITRGSWDKVECADKGLLIANRTLEVRSDTTIEISINHWADHFPKQ